MEERAGEYISCRTNCPVPIKNVMLGCSGRPVKYQKECPRVEQYMKSSKKKMAEDRKYQLDELAVSDTLS